LYDECRKRWVEAAPEEFVRQKCLNLLIQEKGFPKSLIGVEKSLRDISSYSANKQIPNRRIDIVCFAKHIHASYELYPLLLIECKEKKIDEDAKQQLIGYNDFVNAYFLGLASPDEFLFGYYHESTSSYQFYHYLPSFKQLMCVFPHASH